MDNVERSEKEQIRELRRRIHDLEMKVFGYTNGPEPDMPEGVNENQMP